MDLSIRTTLRHLTLITWAVPAGELQTYLPEGLRLATVPGPEGPCGLFSLALMIEGGMAFEKVPWVDLTFPQWNERVYVTRDDGSDPGVFFWRSRVASRSWVLPRFALGLPYERSDMELTVCDGVLTFTREGSRAVSVSLDGRSDLAPVDPEAVRAIVSDPMVGYALRRGRELVGFTVEHNPIAFAEARADFVDTNGLIAEKALQRGQSPALTLYAPEAPFAIKLPPRVVA